MVLMGFIPFGKQRIVISVDNEMKHIRDNGYSKLISRWDHNLYLKTIGSNKTLFADTIDIDAGIFTIFIVGFARQGPLAPKFCSMKAGPPHRSPPAALRTLLSLTVAELFSGQRPSKLILAAAGLELQAFPFRKHLKLLHGL